MAADGLVFGRVDGLCVGYRRNIGRDDDAGAGKGFGGDLGGRHVYRWGFKFRFNGFQRRDDDRFRLYRRRRIVFLCHPNHVFRRRCVFLGRFPGVGDEFIQFSAAFRFLGRVVVGPTGRHRQMHQGALKHAHDVGVLNRRHEHRRTGIGAREHHLVDLVHDLDTGLVADKDFAHVTIGFAHHDHGQVFPVGEINADLGAADADGADRGFDAHGIGVGFRHHAADNGVNALEREQRQRAFLGAGIIDHFIQNHASVAAHGERGLVGQDHANGAIGTGFKDVAGIERRVDIQFHAGSVNTDDESLAADGIDGTDGFCGLRAGIGSGANTLFAGRRSGQKPHHGA